MFVIVSFEVPVSDLAKVAMALAPFTRDTRVDNTAAPAAEPGAIERAAEKTRTRRADASAAKAPAKAPAKVAEVVDDDPLGLEEKPAAKAPAKRVTVDDIKAAVQRRVEFAGLDSVKEVFAAHGAEKLSAIKEADYPAVHAALLEGL